METEPTDRLGQGKGGVSEIKDHGFFGSVNWKQLDKRKLQAPWAPEIADPLDCSNFEGGWEEVPDEHRAANTPETDLYAVAELEPSTRRLNPS